MTPIFDLNIGEVCIGFHFPIEHDRDKTSLTYLVSFSFFILWYEIEYFLYI